MPHHRHDDNGESEFKRMLIRYIRKYSKGQDGNTILNGSGAPNNSFGIDGDFYIDTTNGILYGPKHDRRWPSVGISLKGQVGATCAHLEWEQLGLLGQMVYREYLVQSVLME